MPVTLDEFLDKDNWFTNPIAPTCILTDKRRWGINIIEIPHDFGNIRDLYFHECCHAIELVIRGKIDRILLEDFGYDFYITHHPFDIKCPALRCELSVNVIQWMLMKDLNLIQRDWDEYVIHIVKHTYQSIAKTKFPDHPFDPKILEQYLHDYKHFIDARGGIHYVKRVWCEIQQMLLHYSDLQNEMHGNNHNILSE